MTVTQPSRPERTLDSITAALLDKSAESQATRHAFGDHYTYGIGCTFIHAQIDALLDQWEAAR